MSKVVKSDDEWRKQLTPEQFQIARKEGTEPPGTGKYAYNHADGLYHCICCDTVLFDSKTKFESGTGWPSFYQPTRERKTSGNCPTCLQESSGPRCNAFVATPIWDTSLTMVRSRQGYAIAWIRHRSISWPAAKRRVNPLYGIWDLRYASASGTASSHRPCAFKISSITSRAAPRPASCFVI